MSNSNLSVTLHRVDEVVLFVISTLLLAAFYYQLILQELPCALCNLIRVAFLVLGSGFLLNTRFGTSPWNYMLSSAGALIGSLISLLFMFAKALPGTKPTGSAIWGFHMYNWTFVFFMMAIMLCLLIVTLLAIDAKRENAHSSKQGGKFARFVVAFFMLMAFGNLASAFLQNGFGPFRASNQQHYEMLYDGDVMKP